MVVLGPPMLDFTGHARASLGRRPLVCLEYCPHALIVALVNRSYDGAKRWHNVRLVPRPGGSGHAAILTTECKANSLVMSQKQLAATVRVCSLAFWLVTLAGTRLLGHEDDDLPHVYRVRFRQSSRSPRTGIYSGYTKGAEGA